MKLHLTIDARADLASIHRYGRRHFGISQSRAYQARLRAGFSLLLDHPHMGSTIDEVLAGYRCLPIARHRIFYRLQDDVIIVLAVLHEQQLPRLHLSDRNEND